ncbi:6-bladed beta-propeller [Rhodohalobacter halophilus]|uniref:6-bladed beta-propeller n=1 Tax=Rhodohalobacter halophilus TaxID=1812810 RepID=UPI0015B3D646|nr:6-bladed beta-propeller [Rhodohalobacter halophilus]
MLYSCSSANEGTLPEHLQGIENLTVYSEDEAPRFQISLQEVARIDDSDDLILGRISGIQTDKNDRIFISDDSEKRINVYTPDGEFIQSIGRSGQGPGEFETVHNLMIDEAHIYAQDFNKRMVHSYLLSTMEFDKSIPMMSENQRSVLPDGYFPGGFQVLPEGQFLFYYGQSFGRNDDESEQRMDLIYRADREGQLSADPILELETVDPIVLRTDNSISVFGAPFLARVLNSFSPVQGIVVNRTDWFLFKKYDENGNYRRAFYYPFPRKELTREAALNQYNNEGYRRAVRGYDLPETWPAVREFLIDDEGRFWVSTIIDEEGMFEWWVLDEQGNLLAKQIWPSSRTVEHVQNNYLYMTEEDEMGLVEVVKYRLSLN